MTRLVVQEHLGLHFIQRSGTAICALPSAAAPPLNLAAVKQLRPLKDGNGERVHFPGKAENSRFALDDAEVVKPACFREAIGNPNNARKAGVTSAASIFFLI
jgi:hypothetical protein